MPKKRKPDRGYVVFISHSSKDKWIARQMARLIETAGRGCRLRVFLDEKSIEVGASISKTIQANLKACDEFVVLLTRDSIARSWVVFEIGGAVALGKHLVPVVNYVKPAEMPDQIADCRAIDLNDFDTYLAQLMNRARKRKAV